MQITRPTQGASALPSLATKAQRLGLAAAALFAGAAMTATSAQATTIVDPRGDILASFNATTDPVPDLDVVSASATFNATDIILSATMAGTIGTTDEGFYVWGIDRGAGTDLLAHPTSLTDTTPPVGQGVTFDSFITIQNDGTGNVVLLGPADPSKPLDPVPVTGFFNLDPGSVTISGRTIRLTINRARFAAQGFIPQGFDVADYGYNMWPRYRDIVNNGTVADFGPDHSTFKASAAVPEPASWALMIAGFGLAGASLRSRRRATMV
ncbi:PEPxxWA-CTERM sorting domain-containing protein [Phenylobacterium sp.]|uniref:PEPxxWA-CTERM sorting domain-containing protein n=1 Tax=Phenylobacterium sp. TaxID=1871053 RepID=UPI0025F1E931|nr:PEPxxWA-CTERM sorting domain-containing protein [Phenylobacterium sp.]